MAKIYNLLLCAGASCISSGGYSFRDKLVEELKNTKLKTW